MGKKIKKDKMKNFNKMKVGFCLEFTFRQDFINHQIKDLISFIDDNEKFFVNNNYLLVREGLENLSSFFYSLSDVAINDVGISDYYCQFHKMFY